MFSFGCLCFWQNIYCHENFLYSTLFGVSFAVLPYFK